MARIPFTDEMHSKLIELEKLTGIGPYTLVAQWNSKPEGLSETTISNWLKRRVKSVDESSYKATVKYWGSFDASIKITAKMRKALIAERKRVGVGPEALLKYANEQLPDRLTLHAINRWMSGEAQTANKAHFDFIMRVYARLTPEDIYHRRFLSRPNTIVLTDEIRTNLKILRDKSGVGPAKLIRLNPDRPHGLSSAHIISWLNGTVKTAPRSYLEFVQAAWPEVETEIRVTKPMVKSIDTEFQRTGASIKQVMSLCPYFAKKYSKNVLSALKTGKRRTIEKTVWEEITRALASLPDQSLLSKKKAYLGKNVKPKKYSEASDDAAKKNKQPTLSNLPDDLVLIQEKDRQAIREHRERTGKSATMLLRHFDHEKPEKLSANMISGWVNGPSKFASKSRLLWVLSKWRELPDKPKNR